MKKHRYIGLAVHKDRISIAVAEAGRRGEVRDYGRVGGSLIALERALRKLRKEGAALHCAYEAGPCGFVIYRRLKTLGIADNVAQQSRNAPRAPATAEPAHESQHQLVTPPHFALQRTKSSPCRKISTGLVLPALSRRNHKALPSHPQGNSPARSLPNTHLPKAKSNLP